MTTQRNSCRRPVRRLVAAGLFGILATWPACGAGTNFFGSYHLTPPTGMHVPTNAVAVTFAGGIVVSNFAQRSFTTAMAPPPPSSPITYSFGSTVELTLSLDGGASYMDCRAGAPSTLFAAYLTTTGGVDVYATELKSLDTVVLPGGALLRESPSLPSLGIHRIQTVSGGCLVSSFFDVWFEVSTNGGGAWVPAAQALHVELRPDPFIIATPMLSQSPLLAPPLGAYVSDSAQIYANGEFMGNPQLRLCFPSVTPPPLGQSTQCTFNAALDQLYSFRFTPCRANATATVRYTHTRDFAGEALFETEITSLLASGDDLPAGVTFRSSPTIPSRGGMSLRAAGADTQLSSFFDLFTEVSADNGNTWSPAITGPLPMQAEAIGPISTFASSNYPPFTGNFLTASTYTGMFSSDLQIRNVQLRRFTSNISLPEPGATETLSEGATVLLDLSTTGGSSFSSVSAPAAMYFSIQGTTNSGTVRYFNTELLTLSFSGGTLPRDMLFRESPSRASLGRTGVRPLESGEARIDSFFDVWLEISTDGGSSWTEAQHAPATLALEYLAPLHVYVPPDSTILADSPSGATVYYIPTVTGGYPPITTSNTPPSGSTFPVGRTVVSCSASDSRGQYDCATFSVTVLPYAAPPEIHFPSNNLPPATGAYVSPALFFTAYAPGVAVRNLRLREFSASFPPPAGTDTHSFDASAEFDISVDSGATWAPVVVPASATVKTTHSHDSGGTSYYDTELLALNVAALGGAVMVRESPTLPSYGRTTIRAVNGGFLISSFFDIFTEISIDGGSTWSPDSGGGQVELRADPAQVPVVTPPTALLPPPTDEYRTPAESVFAKHSEGVIVKNLRCGRFRRSSLPPPAGPPATLTCYATVDYQLSTDAGVSWHWGRSQVLAQFATTLLGAPSISEWLDGEMQCFDIGGGDLPAGFLIRKNYVLPSRGETRIESLPDGTFRLNSFFDVFADMSLNCGVSWEPNPASPTRLTLRTGDPEDQFPSPNVPPLNGAYAFTNRAAWAAFFDNGIIISNFTQRAFSATFPPPLPGDGTAVENYGATLDLTISTDNGLTFVPCSLPCTTQVGTTNIATQGDTLYAETEIRWLSASGPAPGLSLGLMIRESPTKSSFGRTSVTDPTTRTPYQVSSFFDVFIEISVDDGNTWHPSLLGPMRLNLVPQAVERDTFPFARGTVKLRKANGSTEEVRLTGTTTFAVAIDPEGHATDTDANGLDDVRAEMTTLDLHGSSSMGTVHVTLNPSRPTTGWFEEQVNNTAGILDVPPFTTTGTVNSFFDVFFRIEVGSDVLYGQTASHMLATLTHKPPAPGETYVADPRTPITLVYGGGKTSTLTLAGATLMPNIQTETDIFPEALARVTLDLPGVGNERVTLVGPATIEVGIPPDGSAVDTDGDGLDQVPARLAALELRGHSSAGLVRLTLDPSRTTWGEMEEQVNDNPGILDLPPFTATGSASSFFDLYFRMDVNGQQYLGENAAHITALLTHKPPAKNETYRTDQQGFRPISLLKTNGGRSEISLQAAAFTPNPFIEVDTFPRAAASLMIQNYLGEIENVRLHGPAEEHVYVGPAGQAQDWNGNGLDDVMSRLTQLSLTGTCALGFVRLKVSSDWPSLGQMEEQANNTSDTLDVPPFEPTGTASSFFDVFCRLEVGTNVLQSVTPAHFQTVLSHKPPALGETYVPLPQAFFQLINSEGRVTALTLQGYTPNPWVDPEVFPEVVARIRLAQAVGAPEDIDLVGTATIQLRLPPDGAATDSNFNGLDDTPLEITALDLRGNGAIGPVRLTLNPDLPTLGQMEEQVNNTPGTLDLPPFTATGAASSFFNLYIRLETNGVASHNIAPACLTTTLTHAPPAPGETFVMPSGAVPLLDERGVPTGKVLKQARLTPNPYIENDAWPLTTTHLQLALPGGTNEIVSLSGSSSAHVYVNPAGAATDLDGNGLDQVVAQLMAVDLSGVCSLGAVHATLNPDRVSLGGIEELIDNTPGKLDVPPFTPTGSATNWFDAYFRFVIGGSALHNRQRLPLGALIHHKPPAAGELFATPGSTPIPLLDADGNPTSFSVLYLAQSPNTPVLSLSNAPPQGMCLSWPVPSDGYVLQWRTNLLAGPAWSDLSPTIFIVGDRKLAYTNPPAPAGFFRLHHPLP